jgi:hypothetical protein
MTQTTSEFAGISSPSPTMAFGESATGNAPSSYASSSVTSEPERPKQEGAAPHARRTPKTAVVNGRVRLAVCLRDALSLALTLEQAVATEDVEMAAIAGLDLRNSLRELWKCRAIRSDDWATVVNKLQIATSQVHFERFTSDMAVAVRMVIQSHLEPDADNDDVRASTTLLERAKLHAWCNGSGEGESNGDSE